LPYPKGGEKKRRAALEGGRKKRVPRMREHMKKMFYVRGKKKGEKKGPAKVAANDPREGTAGRPREKDRAQRKG